MAGEGSASSAERITLGLGDRLAQVRGQLTQEAFAKSLGISLRTYIRYESEERLPDAELVAKVGEVYGVDMAWLITGKRAERPGYSLLPRYDISASAGPGSFLDLEPEPEVIAVDVEWLRQELRVSPEQVSMIDVRGDSMEPTIHDGDVILVNSRVEQIRDGIYVLRFDGLLMVKRLQRQPGSWVRVTSDNSAYEPFSVNLQDESTDFAVLGKVIWVGRKLSS